MKIMLKEVPLEEGRDDGQIVASIIDSLQRKGVLNLDENSLHGTINHLYITFSVDANNFLPQILCDHHNKGKERVLSVLSDENHDAIQVDLDDLRLFLVKNKLITVLPKSYDITRGGRVITLHITSN